jgi:hypothetical protein
MTVNQGMVSGIQSMYFHHLRCLSAALLFVLALALETMAAAPVNDHFRHRIPLHGTNVAIAGRTIEATAESDEPDHAGASDGHSVWYSWRAPVNGIVDFSLRNLDSPPEPTQLPLLTVYARNPHFGLVPLVDNNNTNDALVSEFGRTFALVTTSARAGLTYYLAVDVKTGSPPQRFELALNLARAPRNDDLALAPRLHGAALTVINGSTAYATREPGEPVVFQNLGGSVWWTWVAPANGTVRLEATGACPGDTCSPAVSVFTGRGMKNLMLVATNRFAPRGMEPDLLFSATRGRAYHIRAEPGPTSFDRVVLDLEIDTFRLLSPTNHATYAEGSSVPLKLARLSPAFDGVFDQVDFVIDIDAVRVSRQPFHYTWTNPPPGIHTLSAYATNRAGRIRVAPWVTITIASTNAP